MFVELRRGLHIAKKAWVQCWSFLPPPTPSKTIENDSTQNIWRSPSGNDQATFGVTFWPLFAFSKVCCALENPDGSKIYLESILHYQMTSQLA